MTAFLLSLFLATHPAAAEEFALVCKGIHGTPETVTFEFKYQGLLNEDEPRDVSVKLKDNGVTFYDSLVEAVAEDVQVFLASKDGKFQGSLYMDELDQTSINYKGQDFRFDCND